MLQRVVFQNAQGGAFNLLLSSKSEGYESRGIDGLDPVKADIVTSAFATIDGEQYQASHRQKRNIIVNLGMVVGHPTKSIRQLRQGLYSFFMPEMDVTMYFEDSEEGTVRISGKIESLVAPLFVKDPEAQISILCFDPDFYALDKVVMNGETTSGSTETAVDYPGTVETGLLFEMPVVDPIDGFVFYQTSGGVLRTMEVDYDFLAGDLIRVSTMAGDKYVNVKREGLEYSILYAMSTYSSWALLQPGANSVRVVVDGDPIPYTLTYPVKFGGL